MCVHCHALLVQEGQEEGCIGLLLLYLDLLYLEMGHHSCKLGLNFHKLSLCYRLLLLEACHLVIVAISRLVSQCLEINSHCLHKYLSAKV